MSDCTCILYIHWTLTSPALGQLVVQRHPLFGRVAGRLPVCETFMKTSNLQDLLSKVEANRPLASQASILPLATSSRPNVSTVKSALCC